MGLQKCPDCGNQVSDQAPACPTCGRPIVATKAQTGTGSRLLGCLGLVALGSLLMIGFCVYTVSQLPRVPSAQTAAGGASTPATVEPVLELQSWTWGEQYSHAIAEGQVKNISIASLKNVQAQVSFFTADQTFISSADALLEFNPVLPGQSSPFKVIATWNPAMKKASVTFKTIFGPELAWRDKPKPSPSAKKGGAGAEKGAAGAEGGQLQRSKVPTKTIATIEFAEKSGRIVKLEITDTGVKTSTGEWVWCGEQERMSVGFPWLSVDGALFELADDATKLPDGNTSRFNVDRAYGLMTTTCEAWGKRFPGLRRQ